MAQYRAAIRLDERNAFIFFVGDEGYAPDAVDPTHPHQCILRRGAPPSPGMESADDGYFRDIVDAIMPAREWLVLGPCQAKLSLLKHVFSLERSLAARVVGVESIDLPTDARIAQLARQYFMTLPKTTAIPN